MIQDVLKRLRKINNITASSVADDLGILPATYRNYETGRREPSVEMICKLADYFGVTTDYLLGREPAGPVEDKLSQDEASLIDRYRIMTDEHKRFIDAATMIVEEAERNKV